MKIQFVWFPGYIGFGWYDVPGGGDVPGFRGWMFGWFEVRFR